MNNAALVVGGGMAGMTAAVALAEQGFPVHLVEKTDQLGGTARRSTPRSTARTCRPCWPTPSAASSRIPRITVHRSAQVAKVEGHVGNFTSQNRHAERHAEVKHGVVILATGATEQKPQSFGYGQSPRVLTQLELSDRLGRGELSLPAEPTVVMIQCVEQRDEERPYCSRVCCTTAVKNALALKARFPQGAGDGALSRHADLRFPRGRLSRGPGEGRAVCPLRAGAAAAAGGQRHGCACAVARAVARTD